MSKGVGFRPKLLPPRGRRLQKSRRPLFTCITVSSCIAVLVFVVFGLTAYNIYNNRFGHTQHDYHAGDMVSMLESSTDLSSAFCDAYDVKTFNKTDFYLLPSHAWVDPFARYDINFNISMQPGHSSIFLYRAHHLLVNTTVTLQACRNLESLGVADGDVSTEFVVISGRDDFEVWQKVFNSKHALHRVAIPKNASCGNNASSLPHLNFTVQHSNDFFFLLVRQQHEFHSWPGIAGEIILSCNISATRYNLSSAVTVCNRSQPSCRFPISWGSKKDVVAWVYGRHPDDSVSFVTDCLERIAFWVPVFAIVPLVIVFLTSLGCAYVLVINRSVESRYQQRQDLDTDSQSSYGAISQDESAPPGATTSTVMSDDDDGCASIQDE